MLNLLHNTKGILQNYRPISLAEMDDVKLLNRVDSKFVLPFDQMVPILESLKDYYRVLTIGHQSVFTYRTDYFDTPTMQMFIDHQNGKLNRFKIRQREYIESKIKFLEIKFKSNKGRVIKERIEKTAEDKDAFTKFIQKYSPYNADSLSVVIVNKFNRFTLVDNNLQERVTVDLNLRFSDNQKELGLNGLVIIEVKQDKNSRQSKIFGILKENGLRPCSFSKYCLGVSMLKRHNKMNNFKRTINIVNKLSHAELSA